MKTPPLTRPRRYVTTEFAAEYLGVSNKTIRRWIDQGLLTGYRVGPRYVRVNFADLEAAVVREIPATGGDHDNVA